MVSHRQERVSEMLREELSILIGTELSDPRLEDALVGVTDVKVMPDLRSARVYIEHALPPEKTRQVLSALQHSTTFLRQALLVNLNLRYVPELTFHVDTSSERGRRVDALLDAIAHVHEDPSKSQPQNAPDTRTAVVDDAE